MSADTVNIGSRIPNLTNTKLSKENLQFNMKC